jgi:L-rhamnose mutarotase
MKQLIQYLDDTNGRMLIEIMAFLKEYGKLSKTDYDNIESFIKNIDVWNLDNDKNDGLSTVTQFIKNSVFAMIKNYPNVILNSTNYNTIPAIMGDMSNIHKRDVSNFVKSYTADLSKFKGDKKLVDFLQVVHGRLIDLNTLTEHLTVQTSIKKDGETFYSLFDKSTTYMLFKYCWYTVIHEYMTVSKNDTLLRSDVQLLKQARREHIRENQNVSDSMGSADIDESDPGAIDVNDDLETIKLKEEIRRGELIDLKTNVCSLILAFIRMEQKNKKSLDYSYEQITKRVIQSREEEKKKITGFLEKMEKDERAVEKMLKKYKIGRWNAGMQKGLFQYDKNTYDRERDENVARLFDDLEYGQADGEGGVTAEELDQEADDKADAEAEHPGIDDLDENYNDGTYYEEDRDEDREE